MRKVGIGVIGIGVWGIMHADVYSKYEGADFIAICDIDEEKAKVAAKKYGAKKYYTDYRDLINDPEIEAVGIATPDFAHKEPAIYAAEHGKNILIEKPLATSLSDAIEINEAAKKNSVILMVDFHNRWNPSFISAKDQIVGGMLGAPKYIYIRHSNTKYVPFHMLSWSSQSSVLWFLGSHSNDIARWMLDSEVEKVYTVSRKGVLQKAGLDIPDFFTSILEYKNGCVATIENSWILPNTLPVVGNFSAELLCEKGVHYVEFCPNNAAMTYTDECAKMSDLTAENKVYGQFKGFCFDSIIHFIDCVREGKKPIVDGDDGVENTRTLEAMSKSLEIGGPVKIIR